MVSQTADEPQFPSSPSLTNLGRSLLKYISHIVLFIFIESEIGCKT